MKIEFRSKLIVEILDGGKYVRLVEPFIFFSERLNQEVEVPTGFICDFESVPVFKPTSKRGGVVHDYFCRKDSVPRVPKQKAASLYHDAQVSRDAKLKDSNYTIFKRILSRNFKTIVVRVAPGYFHKKRVTATIAEMRGEK